jgi:predicted O-methyltransferase YrrM
LDLRPKRFWTPRYIRDRLLVAYDQRLHPTLPWWPRHAIRLLDDLLRPTDHVLEWGSGRSTVWLDERVSRVRSIEHDPTWFKRVRDQLAAQNADLEAVQLRHVAPKRNPLDSPYVRAIDEFDDGELSVCIVDGEHRAACALAAAPKLAPGGLLVVDDAHWFIDHPTRSPRSRHGKGHASEGWTEFLRHVGPWRSLWASDGVTDTAIWLKP